MPPLVLPENFCTLLAGLQMQERILITKHSHKREDTMQLYVKATSNCPEGMQLMSFRELSETWTGEQVVIPFGEGKERRILPVIGWTDLFTGRPCPVNIVKAEGPKGETGYLVYGGNSGLRVLDTDREPREWEAHLPPGWGMPIIWVEDVYDLPAEVCVVVE